ncbi:MAG TPA: hypothetical protein VK539_01075 [Myxococcaceae bacterium]|nr:hypothetical protein [Myxococcaceae bacterium]
MLTKLSVTQREVLAKLEAIHLLPMLDTSKDTTVERCLVEALSAQGFRVVQESEVPQFSVIHDLSYHATVVGGAHVLVAEVFYSPKLEGNRFLPPVSTWSHNAQGSSLADVCLIVAKELRQDFDAVRMKRA